MENLAVGKAADDLGKQIADMFGIKHCGQIDISITRGIVTLTAKFIPKTDEMEKVQVLLEKFKLVPIDQEEGDA